MDLIRTLEDDAEVHYPSDEEASSSDQDEPPRKQLAEAKKSQATKAKAGEHFENDFEFVTNQEEYMRDPWHDPVSGMLRKKHKNTLDQKISKVRKERKLELKKAKQAEQKEEKAGDEAEAEDGDGDEDEQPMDVDANGERSSDEDEDAESDFEDDESLARDELKVKASEMKRKDRKKVKEKAFGKDTKGKSGVRIEGEATQMDGDEFFEEFRVNESTQQDSSFYTMNLSRPLLKAIEALHFAHPTPIQAAALPLALAGRDICGCAATGTGKTAAYVLPVLERLLFRPKESSPTTRVLVLVPTRELGVQVFQVSKQLAQFTTIDIGISVGGLDLRMQEASLRRSPDVVIATPGRLIDHLKNTPSFSLESIEVLILDEADRMLDECFLDQMKEIIKSCARTRQTLLFSATMTDQVEDLAAVSLKKPVKIFVDSNKVVAWNLRQEFVRLRAGKEKNREALLAALLCRTFRDRAMVFIRTKKECHRLHILLGLLGLRVAELHGNMSQASRLHALRQFKEEEVDVLLTTDVAARGLDISGVQTVINYELPYTLEQYIHRVGRTARAGKVGRSVSFADEEHRKMIREIVKNARNPVKSRVIPQAVVEKYCKKVAGLEDAVKKVVAEEQAEREIEALEKKANRMENQLKNGAAAAKTSAAAGGKNEHQRAWFQSKKEREAAQKKAAAKKGHKKFKFETDEEREAFREAEYMARDAKRSRKMKKIRTMVDDDERNGRQGQKRSSKSAFEKDIVNVGRKNIKRLRHEGHAPRKGRKK